MIAAAVLNAVIIAACETSSTISQAPTPVKCQVNLAAPPMLDAGGGTGTLSITTEAECAWDVSTSSTWITALDPSSGQGPGKVSFRVAENSGSATRDGVILVNGEQVRVSQRAPCQFNLGPSSQSMPAGGGSGQITISTASDCTWTAGADAGWITLSSSTSGSGNGVVGFTVAPNQGEARSGSIAVGNQRATISQAGAGASSCNATISPASQNVPASGGPGTPITVRAANTCQWTASSGVPWLSITAGAAGSGNGTVTFTVAANTGASRTGALTIAGRALTVTQAAASGPATPPPASCTYSISPANDDVSSLGGAGRVDVSASNGCEWTASSNASWITITSGASGSGNGRVNYLVLANVAGSRTGTLTIAGQTFTLTQAALLCTYSVSPGKQRVEAEAGSGTFSVSTSSGCSWTAHSDASWLTVTAGASGAGDGSVSFSHTANTGDADRKGTLTIAGRTVEVEQKKPKGKGRGQGEEDD